MQGGTQRKKTPVDPGSAVHTAGSNHHDGVTCEHLSASNHGEWSGWAAAAAGERPAEQQIIGGWVRLLWGSAHSPVAVAAGVSSIPAPAAADQRRSSSSSSSSSSKLSLLAPLHSQLVHQREKQPGSSQAVCWRLARPAAEHPNTSSSRSATQ